MHRILVSVVSLALIVVSFRAGQMAAPRISIPETQIRGSTRRTDAAVKFEEVRTFRLLANESDVAKNLLVGNVPTASFGELWDVLHSASPHQRRAWARELEKMAPGTTRTAAVRAFYQVWVELNPAEAIEAVEQIRDKGIQGSASQAVVNAAADSAISLIAGMEERLGHDLNYFATSPVLFRWSMSDPEGLSHFLATHPMLGSSPYFDVACSWAATDPARAVEWFQGLNLQPLWDPRFPLRKDERRYNAARGLLLSWVTKDPAGAAIYASAHSHDPEINKTLGEFCYALCGRSPSDAFAFVQSLPNERDQRAALARVFENLGDPFVLREGGDEEEPPEPEMPKEQIPRWLASLPRSLWVDEAGAMLARWDSTNPAEAEAWLHTLAPETRTKAIVDYISNATKEEANRVSQLARNIDDPTARREAIRRFEAALKEQPNNGDEVVPVGAPVTGSRGRLIDSNR